jgi:NDP-sugar pyrophosphorylase family protein
MTADATALPAVVLAGGLGTRLGALTAERPKPLVDVAGRPFLDWLLTWLARTGVRDVQLLAGHLGEQIASFVGDGERWGLRASCIIEATPLGTGGALTQAVSLLPEAFLLVYGDSYLPIDYAAVSGAFADCGADALMVVYRDPAGVTGVDPNVSLAGGHVSKYAKGTGGDHTHIDAGVVVLRRSVVAELPVGRSALETELYPALAAAGRLAAYPTAQRFYDMGTPSRLRDLERELCA